MAVPEERRTVIPKLLVIAERIQRQHSTTKRKSRFKRLNIDGDYDVDKQRYATPRERDQKIRDELALHLWQRMGYKSEPIALPIPKRASMR